MLLVLLLHRDSNRGCIGQDQAADTRDREASHSMSDLHRASQEHRRHVAVSSVLLALPSAVRLAVGSQLQGSIRSRGPDAAIKRRSALAMVQHYDQQQPASSSSSYIVDGT